MNPRVHPQMDERAGFRLRYTYILHESVVRMTVGTISGTASARFSSLMVFPQRADHKGYDAHQNKSDHYVSNHWTPSFLLQSIKRWPQSGY